MLYFLETILKMMNVGFKIYDLRFKIYNLQFTIYDLRFTISRLSLILIIFTTLLSGNALAEEEIERLKEKAADIRQRMEKNRTSVGAYTKKEKALIDEMNETELALNRAKKQLSAFRYQISVLEKDILSTLAEYEALKTQIEVEETYVAKRLTALYKLNRLGTMHFLASADSVNDFFQQKRSLERIIAYDASVMKTLNDNTERLSKTLENLKAQKEKKLSLEEECKKQIQMISVKKMTREKILSDIRTKKSVALASLHSLKQSSEELDQKIKALKIQMDSEKSDNLSQNPFTSLKGLLKIPVKGKIVSFFGHYKNTEFNVVNFQSGIDIEAPKGEPIHAVYAGKVIYSSWFKGYGNMIIIDHGSSYYSIYAHAEEIYKSRGDRVETGEVIASVGDTGSFTGDKLHFEVRHHGKPLDPMEWLKK